MSESITLTAAATAAAQFLGVLDSGEALSTQQLNDAFAAANNMLANWTNEQTLALQELIDEQTRALKAFVDKQALEAQPLVTRQAQSGAVLLDEQLREAKPLAVAFTLSGATYTVGTYTAPSYTPAGFTAPIVTPGTIPQFADNTTPINVPNGYSRKLKLALAIELAPQYDVEPSATLREQYKEAAAAAAPMPGRIPVPGQPGNVITSPANQAATPESAPQ